MTYDVFWELKRRRSRSRFENGKIEERERKRERGGIEGGKREEKLEKRKLASLVIEDNGMCGCVWLCICECKII